MYISVTHLPRISVSGGEAVIKVINDAYQMITSISMMRIIATSQQTRDVAPMSV